ncbi:MAG TPA: PRC-barrel domain-containing protein [Thermomicrobiales bacterium]|nr:PRC-barrel domain-containing protein [Thermomicrobiales bacterium]
MSFFGTHHHEGNLVSLRDSAMTIANRDDDIRGRHVVDANDGEIGWINDLLLGDDAGEISYLDVTCGWFFGYWRSHELIPVIDILDIDDETVHIDRAAGEHPHLPAYHPALTEHTEQHEERHGLRRFMPL